MISDTSRNWAWYLTVVASHSGPHHSCFLGGFGKHPTRDSQTAASTDARVITSNAIVFLHMTKVL